MAEVNKKSREDFEAFVLAHQRLLADQADPDFQALLRFLKAWSPDRWATSGFSVDALDKNIAIQVIGARGRLDEKIEARTLARGVVAAKTEPRQCMLSDAVRPYAAAHPQFRGVHGAQSSGASLVSFNWDAFESYGQLDVLSSGHTDNQHLHLETERGPGQARAPSHPYGHRRPRLYRGGRIARRRGARNSHQTVYRKLLILCEYPSGGAGGGNEAPAYGSANTTSR